MSINNVKSTICQHSKQKGRKKYLLPQESKSDLLLTTGEDWLPSILRPLDYHMTISITFSNFSKIHFRKNRMDSLNHHAIINISFVFLIPPFSN